MFFFIYLLKILRFKIPIKLAAKLSEAVPDRKVLLMGPGSLQIKHGRMEVKGKEPVPIL
jgi:hypothetical protein